MLRSFVLSASVLAILAACSSSDSTSPPGSDSGNNTATPDGGNGTTTPPPGTSYPQAEGDPCRGLPLPTDQSHVPSGLCASVVALNISGARQLAFAPNGDLFVGTDTTLFLLRDEDGDGSYAKAEQHRWADTRGGGNGGHLDIASGYVYAGTAEGASRFKYDPASLVAGPEEKIVVGQPAGGHGKRTVRVYDNVLYAYSGSSGNWSNETSQGTEYDTMRSLVKTFDLTKFTGTPWQWADGTVFTQGVRNANGFVRNETTKKLYAVVNGMDNATYAGADVHNDNPGEQIVELAQGRKYGFPFCYTAQRIVRDGNVVTPGTQLRNEGWNKGQDDAWCAANSQTPTTFVQAHSAPLDLVFFDQQPSGNLPERWRGGAFVAFHGSWNRSPNTGFKVVWQPFNADGTSPMPTSTADTTTFPYEVVLGGGNADAAADGVWTWQSADGTSEGPRPAGVAIGPKDGALYIASDQSGFIYRVGVKK